MYVIYEISSVSTDLCTSDLNSMSERMAAGYYTSSRLFIADLKRLVHNCKNQFSKHSEQVKNVTTLEKFFNSKLKEANVWIDINA